MPEGLQPDQLHPFAFHKMPLQTYLATVVIFCNEMKTKSALALSHDLDVQYKTAFVLVHKLRGVMATERRGYKLGGEGKVVEVDGGYATAEVADPGGKAD